MNALLVILGLIDLSIGALGVWTFAHAVSRYPISLTTADNLYAAIYTAGCFLAPALAWLLRNRLPLLARLAILALPVVLGVWLMDARIWITVR